MNEGYETIALAISLGCLSISLCIACLCGCISHSTAAITKAIRERNK